MEKREKEKQMSVYSPTLCIIDVQTVMVAR